MGAPVRTLRGQALLAARRPEEAIEACMVALQQGEPADIAWFTLARARHRTGDLKGASQALDAAIGADPNREEYWCERGRLLAEAGDARRALRFLDTALELNPQYRQAWLYKGKALERLEDHAAAQTCFDRAKTRTG